MTLLTQLVVQYIRSQLQDIAGKDTDTDITNIIKSGSSEATNLRCSPLWTPTNQWKISETIPRRLLRALWLPISFHHHRDIMLAETQKLG